MGAWSSAGVTRESLIADAISGALDYEPASDGVWTLAIDDGKPSLVLHCIFKRYGRWWCKAVADPVDECPPGRLERAARRGLVAVRNGSEDKTNG